MIISVNWLKKYTDIDLPTDELATLIGGRLVEIEEANDISEKYKDVVVAKVIECNPVEGSDHLNLTSIDDGGKTKNVERDEKGYVQVVCGAPNVKKGLMVAWLPPGSTVPESYGDAEPFVLDARKIRGLVSNGMIASARELDLFDDHGGILELDSSLLAGQSFAGALELDDTILDIENKSLTHRPDTFGVIGFAREIAGIQGKKFETPQWLLETEPKISAPDDIELSVKIDDPELSDRYQAVVLTGANKAATSPLEIQTYLGRSGVRPISAIVDVTNYLMLLSGQPLHAFDYDKVVKVSGGRTDIHVRAGKKDEKLRLLDGREITLSEEDIVIAAGETAIGLAGAMGGVETEIDDTTERIILESATFNLYNLRSTQMRHGIFSEAVTRFTKGQSAPQTAPVLAEAIKLIAQWSGAKPASSIKDDYPNQPKPQPIEVDLQKHVNEFLGASFGMEEVVTTLENVGFSVQVKDPHTAKVTAPYWRADIHIAEDVVEEIGRLNGFDSIKPTLPGRDFTATMPTQFDVTRQKLRDLLSRAGANEVLTYSFVHGDMMKKAGQNTDEAYRIVNSISPDLQYYRQSLTPSLLANVHSNVKSGYDHFALYELNKFHTKKHENTDEGVPKELDSLAFVVTSKKSKTGAAYYEAKRYLEYLADEFHLEFIYTPLEADNNYPVTVAYEPKRSARVTDKLSGERIGVIGELRRPVVKAFKLPEQTAAFEISTRAFAKLSENQPSHYRPSSKFPSTQRDICFQVATKVPYQSITDAISLALKEVTLDWQVTPVDIYQSDDLTSKNITVRLQLADCEKTLTGEDTNAVIDAVTKAVVKATKASVI